MTHYMNHSFLETLRVISSMITRNFFVTRNKQPMRIGTNRMCISRDDNCANTVFVKTHLYSTDPSKIKEYKAYSNKLNRIIHAAKKNHFSKQFELNKENIKYTWKLISKVISTKTVNNRIILSSWEQNLI